MHKHDFFLNDVDGTPMKLVQLILAVTLLCFSITQTGCFAIGLGAGTLIDSGEKSEIIYTSPATLAEAKRRAELGAALRKLRYGEEVELLMASGVKRKGNYAGVIRDVKGADSAVALDQTNIGLDLVTGIATPPLRIGKWIGLGVGAAVDVMVVYWAKAFVRGFRVH